MDVCFPVLLLLLYKSSLMFSNQIVTQNRTKEELKQKWLYIYYFVIVRRINLWDDVKSFRSLLMSYSRYV